MMPEFSPIPANALPLVACPDAVWTRISAQLDQPEEVRSGWRWVFAAAMAAGLAAAVWFGTIDRRPSWNVERNGIAGRAAEGEWIETGAGSARITVGSIGTVAVEPGSRVRILAASPTEHRLELAEGEIEAQINAPPRLFFVDTPAVTAVDLGCAYRMKSDADGNGLLRVTGGWVEMARGDGASLVPAGARCSIRAKRGAGTPMFEDAPAELALRDPAS